MSQLTNNASIITKQETRQADKEAKEVRPEGTQLGAI